MGAGIMAMLSASKFKLVLVKFGCFSIGVAFTVKSSPAGAVGVKFCCDKSMFLLLVNIPSQTPLLSLTA